MHSKKISESKILSRSEKNDWKRQVLQTVYLIHQKLFVNWKHPKFCISLTSLKGRVTNADYRYFEADFGQVSQCDDMLAEEFAYYISTRHNWLWKCSSHWYLSWLHYLRTVHFSGENVALSSDFYWVILTLNILFWCHGYDSLWRRKDSLKKMRNVCFWEMQPGFTSPQEVVSPKECKYIHWFDHWHLIYCVHASVQQSDP